MLNWLCSLFSAPSTSALQASLDGCTAQLSQLQTTALFSAMELQALLESTKADLSQIKLLIPAVLEEAKRIQLGNSKELESELQSLKELLKAPMEAHCEAAELPTWQTE